MNNTIMNNTVDNDIDRETEINRENSPSRLRFETNPSPIRVNNFDSPKERRRVPSLFDILINDEQ